MAGLGRLAARLAAAVAVCATIGACGSSPPPTDQAVAVVETASPTVSPSPSLTPSPSATQSATPTVTPSPTPAPTPVPSITSCPGAESRKSGSSYPYTARSFVAYVIGRGGGNVTCVEATWKQPKVTCGKKDQRFAVSVAIDGWTSAEMHVKAPKTVEVGTESECAGGALTTSGWHLANPEKFFQYFPFHPAVGDIVWAQVRFAGGQYTMALRDKTTGIQVSTTRSVSKISRVTARWEVSAVAIDCDVKCKDLQLAKFSPIVFSSAQATLAGKRVAIGGAAIVDVVNYAANGSVKRLVTSKLSSGGRSFTVTWKHA